MIEDAEFAAIPQAEVQTDLLSIFRGAIKMTIVGASRGAVDEERTVQRGVRLA